MRHRLWERTKTFAAILLSHFMEKNPVKVGERTVHVEPGGDRA